MLDTGITPEHPGFQDPSLKVPGGYPLVSKPENLALTNNKIIVARNYEQFYMEDEPDTARDRYGHGTATAMCAAGVPNQGPYGRIAGVAPKAWIGAYKITSLNGDTANTAVMMKAFDDALADGMDVISVSFGSDLVLPLEQDPISVAVERATGFGMVVVVSAGNSGPALGTIGDTASIPSAISVGASDTDRIFGGSVAIGSAPPIRAFAGSVPSEAISAAVRDAGAFDSSRLACDPLPAGSLNQSIALISRGTCTFEQKLNNAEAAGAKAAIIYSTALQAPAQFTSGKARLPGVLIGFADGNAIQAALQSGADVIARIAFDGIPFPNDPIRLTGFSSRGPTYFYGIKPDLSATGYVYTATQSADEEGGMYNRVGYIETQGTSFSAPLVAGAAAVLKGARPGLSAAQYRSLLINTASPMSLHAGYVERVQQTGAGILNLAGAIGGTVAAYPISLSFGIGPGTIDAFDQLALTNAGKVADTFTISSIPYDDAPPLRFSEDPPGGGATTAVITERIAPGQTRTIYPYWRFKSFGPGEYQGQIIIQGTQPGSMALVPYWYGIPSSVPDAITVVLPPPAQLTVNQTFGIYFRVTDSSGIAVLDRTSLKFNGTVVAGGGTITGLNLNSPFPNLVFASIHMGPELGTNTFRVSFGNLAPITFEIEGVRAKEP
ncbi:MAG: S8 family serine peptidase [Acidobacteria bacterium]|nr:S8 family serine peptidase [Acidobacteriota bacterium]